MVSIMVTTVPQLDICLKFKCIREKRLYCIHNNPQNAISFGHLSSCGTIDNHLTLFKERHLLDEDHVDGIFNPQPRRNAVLVMGIRF